MATKARLEISTFRPMRQRRLGEKLTDSSSGIALFSMLIRLLAKVAQTSSLLYRRFPICRRSRLEVGDTAGWKPALRRYWYEILVGPRLVPLQWQQHLPSIGEHGSMRSAREKTFIQGYTNKHVASVRHCRALPSA